MPISLDMAVGTYHDRKALLVKWRLDSTDSDENVRCFYRAGNTVAIFITEQNVGHPRSDRTYANWLADDQLRMEVHEKDRDANDALRAAGAGVTVGLFFRRRIGTEFTYLGRTKFAGAQPFHRTELYQLSLLDCVNARTLV